MYACVSCGYVSHTEPFFGGYVRPECTWRFYNACRHVPRTLTHHSEHTSTSTSTCHFVRCVSRTCWHINRHLPLRPLRVQNILAHQQALATSSSACPEHTGTSTGTCHFVLYVSRKYWAHQQALATSSSPCPGCTEHFNRHLPLRLLRVQNLTLFLKLFITSFSKRLEHTERILCGYVHSKHLNVSLCVDLCSKP
jgi:hypothetical protein